ncbi:helix-turn-helix domain-containing protein [Streptomyces silvisoli]|uniref:Helix-turn-helix domain-containing protein n=1 Tax=Streptomyces silvisoli TaxID=3034235 RepID=A0ABT5ZRD4_9ACTN|nr:helix-turn-helix domain-containing protein [Streptomyces silvisoli]MDF3292384.1 helix-turn-helix domain-containing protein [Streptomyces silvisoli]
MSLPPSSVDEAAGRLAAALRGLRLAAGRPTLAELGTHAGLPADTIQGIFAGELVPPWSTIVVLTTALRADPALLQGLWDDVRSAFQASSDHFPRGGIILLPSTSQREGDGVPREIVG